jgi:hypothetical protein
MWCKEILKSKKNREQRWERRSEQAKSPTQMVELACNVQGTQTTVEQKQHLLSNFGNVLTCTSCGIPPCSPRSVWNQWKKMWVTNSAKKTCVSLHVLQNMENRTAMEHKIEQQKNREQRWQKRC